jgi:hypothetical protein
VKRYKPDYGRTPFQIEHGVAEASAWWHFNLMSMAELMLLISGLPSEQQNEPGAFLLHLRLQQDPEWREEIGRRIDDNDPAHWTSLEDWRKELAANKGQG